MDPHKNGVTDLALLAVEIAAEIFTQTKAAKNDLKKVVGTIKAVQWPRDVIARIGPIRIK